MNGNSSAGTVNMNVPHVVGDSWAGSKTMIKNEEGQKAALLHFLSAFTFESKWPWPWKTQAAHTSSCGKDVQEPSQKNHTRLVQASLVDRGTTIFLLVCKCMGCCFLYSWGLAK